MARALSLLVLVLGAVWAAAAEHAPVSGNATRAHIFTAEDGSLHLNTGTSRNASATAAAAVYVDGERVVRASELDAVLARLDVLEQGARLTTQFRTNAASDAPWVLAGVDHFTLTRHYLNLAPSAGIVEIQIAMPYSARDATYAGTITVVGTYVGAPTWQANFACFGNIWAASTIDGTAPAYLPVNPGCTNSDISFRRNNDFTANLFVRLAPSATFAKVTLHFNLHFQRL